jgi:transposase
VRIATLAKKLLGVSRIRIGKVQAAEDGITIDVRPRWKQPRCGSCRRRAPGYDRQPARRWRHLALGGTIFWLRYAPRRVECSRCGVHAEAVCWAASLETRFTEAFEELVAYLARATDKTTVSQLLGIAWRSVGSILERVVERRLDAHRLDGLVFIGIDEFSYRKRHHYLSVIVDHIERRVVWAGEGRSSETLARFFDELGAMRAAKIECITLDMSAGYLKTIRERAPQAQVVFDRFHVQRLASDAVDGVRREQMRELDDPAERRVIKRSRFALLSNPWNLSRRQGEKLRQIERHNRPPYRAYLLKETLARALDYRQPKRAERALTEWLAWASRSRLRPFVRLARTVRQHRGGILAYVAYRLTNGVVEGINNRLRMIARRAFGFRGPKPLIAMLFLCCGGITLHPPLPRVS